MDKVPLARKILRPWFELSKSRREVMSQLALVVVEGRERMDDLKTG